MFEISNTCDDSWLARAFEDVVECILMQLRVQTHPLARLFIFKHINGRACVYVCICVYTMCVWVWVRACVRACVHVCVCGGGGGVEIMWSWG